MDEYILQLLTAGTGERGNVAIPPEAEEALRVQFGLDKPMYVRYVKWAWQVLQGDFGRSLEFQKPVSELIGERLLMTIILAGTTALFAWGISIPIGIYSAVRQHSVEDYTITFIGFMGLAVPDFLLALWARHSTLPGCRTSIRIACGARSSNSARRFARRRRNLKLGARILVTRTF